MRKKYKPGETITFRLLKRDHDLADFLNAQESPHETIREGIRVVMNGSNLESADRPLNEIVRKVVEEVVNQLDNRTPDINVSKPDNLDNKFATISDLESLIDF